jgi:hypothetical protein
LISRPGGNCHNLSAGLSSLHDDLGHEAVWVSVDKHWMHALKHSGRWF